MVCITREILEYRETTEDSKINLSIHCPWSLELKIHLPAQLRTQQSSLGTTRPNKIIQIYNECSKKKIKKINK
jgi:hypothetical protein